MAFTSKATKRVRNSCILLFKCFCPYFCIYASTESQHAVTHHSFHAGDVCQHLHAFDATATLQPLHFGSSHLTPPRSHSRSSCSMKTTPRLRLWGGLLLLAATSESFQRTPSSRAHTRLHASTTLTELLEALKPYAPVRCIVVLPGAGAILESAVDASRWTMSESTTPTGKTLLTCKIADGGLPPPFELHLDVDRAKKATLGVSPKTGGPIVRVMDGDGAGLVTLLPTGDSFVDDVVGKLGEEVDLVRR